MIRDHNAIALARTPVYDSLRARYPIAQLIASGEAVGLPPGQMGNSEVGHMNLGAGRIVYQDLTRVDAAIEDGSFFVNDELRAACAAAKAANGTLHVMGLLSPGGVHSHEQHIFAMLELARREGVPRVAVHAFLDGRDTPPRSAEPSLRALQSRCEALGDTQPPPGGEGAQRRRGQHHHDRHAHESTRVSESRRLAGAGGAIEASAPSIRPSAHANASRMFCAIDEYSQRP